MLVTISGNLIEVTKTDGTTEVYNGLQITSEGDIPGVTSYAPGSQIQPLQVNPPTKVTDWTVMVHLSDQRWWQFDVKDVSNQPTWTNNLAGANNAVADISAAMVASGGGGGGVTSVAASSPLSSSGGATPTISLTGIIPAANGGAGTINGILKANGSGLVSQATAGTDYLTPTGNGSGLTGITAAQVGADPAGSAATAEANAAAYTEFKVGQEATAREVAQQRYKVDLVTTANTPLTSLAAGIVVQGVTLLNGITRILVTGNGPTVNGPYLASAGIAVRDDAFGGGGAFNMYDDIVSAQYVCSQGDYAGTVWISPDRVIASGGTIGTDPINFQQQQNAIELFTQTAHGFSAGDNLYLASANTFAKARANSGTTTYAMLRVVSVPGVNTFFGAYPGTHVPATGLTAGNYFLSPSTAGAMTVSDTSTVGEFSAPLGVAISSTKFLFAPLRPQEITAPPTAAYSILTGRITFNGTSTPSLSSYQSTLSASPSIARTGAGVYTITATGAYAGNTWFLPAGTDGDQGVLYDANVDSIIRFSWSNNDDVVSLVVVDAVGDPFDIDGPGFLGIEIRVYP